MIDMFITTTALITALGAALALTILLMCERKNGKRLRHVLLLLIGIVLCLYYAGGFATIVMGLAVSTEDTFRALIPFVFFLIVALSYEQYENTQAIETIKELRNKIKVDG